MNHWACFVLGGYFTVALCLALDYYFDGFEEDVP